MRSGVQRQPGPDDYGFSLQQSSTFWVTFIAAWRNNSQMTIRSIDSGQDQEYRKSNQDQKYRETETEKRDRRNKIWSSERDGTRSGDRNGIKRQTEQDQETEEEDGRKKNERRGRTAQIESQKAGKREKGRKER